MIFSFVQIHNKYRNKKKKKKKKKKKIEKKGRIIDYFDLKIFQIFLKGKKK
ncbi:hypothetical protein RhiirC2_107190 [Rhizophagus irregularis]|uniref:Uncharacterized protein n=1 Tax=Rhizophagus irregularis TaxID=588596 RepID=A0A2N1MRP6_9GLOM|nr:hypothetical protein RhiirC2_107190 [Rhizophagus irregularis]